MTITNIKAQVKNPGRVSVYVDQKYSFSLGYTQLLEQKLHAGLAITEGRLAELQHISNLSKAYERALHYSLLRPRSVRELRDYCRRKQMSPEDAETVIRKLIAKGYVDDHAFARAWVESRTLTKSTSRRKLRAELQQKGVKSSIITEVLQADVHNEQQALDDLVAKKRRLARYQDQQKLMQYLARQGFGLDDIRRALAD